MLLIIRVRLRWVAERLTLGLATPTAQSLFTPLPEPARVTRKAKSVVSLLNRRIGGSRAKLDARETSGALPAILCPPAG